MLGSHGNGGQGWRRNASGQSRWVYKAGTSPVLLERESSNNGNSSARLPSSLSTPSSITGAKSLSLLFRLLQLRRPRKCTFHTIKEGENRESCCGAHVAESLRWLPGGYSTVRTVPASCVPAFWKGLLLLTPLSLTDLHTKPPPWLCLYLFSLLGEARLVARWKRRRCFQRPSLSGGRRSVRRKATAQREASFAFSSTTNLHRGVLDVFLQKGNLWSAPEILIRLLCR